ncbi:hypothetical protein [Clostridium sp. JN-9]|uniref:DUF6414 family protein n=1 Tax=Clostridium sp. JN-9 TaxID=2507159 RepID=UPI000FFE2791|nr:hypothetical protein [Clostridium sp. JN-9]QAT40249.1 hypothetical protein EQM05_08250 [Clostridium sp. JN-9]
MESNKAAIPLYLNSNMTNNLFTVLVQEYSQTKTETSKSQFTLNFTTPINELLFDKNGRCMQGDLNIQLLNESSKQISDERLSLIILIFLNLKKILSDNNLLKVLSSNTIEDIKVNDYIEFDSILEPLPIIKSLGNLIFSMENSLAFLPLLDNINNIEEEKNSTKYILEMLKNTLNTYQCSNCVKYIAKTPWQKNQFILPLDISNLTDKIDYLTDCKVTTLGKVIKITDKNPDLSCSILQTGNSIDYIDKKVLSKLEDKYLKEHTSNAFKDSTADTQIKKVIEILPIAIYI